MREIAEDLDLNVDLEADLIALAQYHVNEFDGRGKINQVLIEEFTKGAKFTKNHEVLAELPISIYWTTNYDKLIEQALENNEKVVDSNIVPQNLAYTTPETDAIVYKMHGDSTLAHEAVLTKMIMRGMTLSVSCIVQHFKEIYYQKLSYLLALVLMILIYLIYLAGLGFF